MNFKDKFSEISAAGIRNGGNRNDIIEGFTAQRANEIIDFHDVIGVGNQGGKCFAVPNNPELVMLVRSLDGMNLMPGQLLEKTNELVQKEVLTPQLYAQIINAGKEACLLYQKVPGDRMFTDQHTANGQRLSPIELLRDTDSRLDKLLAMPKERYVKYFHDIREIFAAGLEVDPLNLENRFVDPNTGIYSIDINGKSFVRISDEMLYLKDGQLPNYNKMDPIEVSLLLNPTRIQQVEAKAIMQSLGNGSLTMPQIQRYTEKKMTLLNLFRHGLVENGLSNSGFEIAQATMKTL